MHELKLRNFEISKESKQILLGEDGEEEEKSILFIFENYEFKFSNFSAAFFHCLPNSKTTISGLHVFRDQLFLETFFLFFQLIFPVCFLIDLMDPDKADFPLMPVFDADPDIINPILSQTSDKSKDDMKDDKDKKSKDNQKEHTLFQSTCQI